MLRGQTTPGFSEATFTSERSTEWQTRHLGDAAYDANAIINSAAVDAGNTPTTTLRAGLLMGKRTADGEWSPYDPDATDGTQQAQGFLGREVTMYNPITGAVEDQIAGDAVVISGRVKAAGLINLDRQARNQLSGRFHFDDENAPSFAPFRTVVDQATSVTVTAAQNGSLFTTAGASGAMVFTLPALAAGLRFRFLNVVNQDMTITSADADKMIAVNDATATSIAASTSNQKIGAHLEVQAVYVGAVLKWVVTNLSPGVVTLTAS